MQPNHLTLPRPRWHGALPYLQSGTQLLGLVVGLVDHLNRLVDADVLRLLARQPFTEAGTVAHQSAVALRASERENERNIVNGDEVVVNVVTPVAVQAQRSALDSDVGMDPQQPRPADGIALDQPRTGAEGAALCIAVSVDPTDGRHGEAALWQRVKHGVVGQYDRVLVRVKRTRNARPE